MINFSTWVLNFQAFFIFITTLYVKNGYENAKNLGLKQRNDQAASDIFEKVAGDNGAKKLSNPVKYGRN